MKQFLKTVFASTLGVFAAIAILVLLTMAGLIGIASMGSSFSSIKDNSVLVIQLQGIISERSEENPFRELWNSNTLQQQGLDDILSAIEHAKNEPFVKGIYIEAGTLVSAMPATLQAIRHALDDFRQSGKFVIAYGDAYTQGAYYVCSVADTLIVNPQGMIDWKGLSSQRFYYKDLLKKIGVNVQVIKVGTYKSATEPYLLNEMSEANREQTATYTKEIWDELAAAVAQSRKLTTSKVNELADSMMLLQKASHYLQQGLVDKVAYSDEVPQTLARMMHVASPDDYHTVSVQNLAGLSGSKPKSLSGHVIAVYYATGDIVDEPMGDFTFSPEIVGKKVCKDLQDLAEDDDVKAVVLRINSGGGSAYASEQIWHQVAKLKAAKPVIVSMGDMAASGGYYISCAAHYIVSEPTTLTGSIGIFGLFPDASELLNEHLGIHSGTVKTHEFADFGDMARPFTEHERALAQKYINRGYQLFTKRCAEGRGMKQEDIKRIGEGRVWTGVHAKEIGLVDELGGIDKAIEKAKQLAGVNDASVIAFPAKADIFENLFNELQSTSYADRQIQKVMGDYYLFFSDMKNVHHKTGNQTCVPYRLTFNL